MIQTAKIKAILFLKTKKKLIIRSIEIKKEAKNIMVWILKKTHDRRKGHCSNGLCRISKCIEMKSAVMLVKVDEMYNILKCILATV